MRQKSEFKSSKREEKKSHKRGMKVVGLRSVQTLKHVIVKKGKKAGNE